MIALATISAAMALATEASASTPTQQVPLGNDRAGFADDCPAEPGFYWHFVATPSNNQFAFVSITLDLGSTTVTVSGSDIIPNGGQLDNVFVRRPAGFEFTDLVATGSSAVITPATPEAAFRLSHRCATYGQPTTTIAPSTTSTTIAAPTTTTTVPDTTTSTTTSTTTTTSTSTSTSTTTTTSPDVLPQVTTTLVGSAGPTTTTLVASAGPTTTVAPTLPATGSDAPTSFAVLALVLATVGGALLALGRRARPAVTADQPD